MSHDLNFNPASVTDLFLNKLITAPLKIRAAPGGHGQYINATLNKDGSVALNNRCFTDLQQAMDACPHPHTNSSNFWQFWACFSSDRQTWVPLEHLRAELAFGPLSTDPLSTEIKTSDTHPLRIDSLCVPDSSAQIGLTFCPGKHSKGIYGGTWKRNLNKDLKTIEAWGCTALITLIEDHEFARLGVANFAQTVARYPFEWFHLPIEDMQPPHEQFEKQWAIAGPQLQQHLSSGRTIVIHCRGGLGRTGLLAARMLVERGLAPDRAVDAVRIARAHTIETYAQEHYILTEQWNRIST